MPLTLFSISGHLGFRGDPKQVIETCHAPGGLTVRHEFQPGGKTAHVTLTTTTYESRSTYHHDPTSREIEHLLTLGNGHATRAVTRLDHLTRIRKIKYHLQVSHGMRLAF